MKEVTRQFLEKAEQAIAAAQQLLTSGSTEFAAGRAYYAMFYVAEALLNERDLRFRKHGGVHGAFGEHFAKMGVLDSKYHQWLLAAFEKRITGDYEVGESIETSEVETMIQQAAGVSASSPRVPRQPTLESCLGQHFQSVLTMTEGVARGMTTILAMDQGTTGTRATTMPFCDRRFTG